MTERRSTRIRGQAPDTNLVTLDQLAAIERRGNAAQRRNRDGGSGSRGGPGGGDGARGGRGRNRCTAGSGAVGPQARTANIASAQHESAEASQSTLEGQNAATGQRDVTAEQPQQHRAQQTESSSTASTTANLGIVETLQTSAQLVPNSHHGSTQPPEIAVNASSIRTAAASTTGAEGTGRERDLARSSSNAVATQVTGSALAKAGEMETGVSKKSAKPFHPCSEVTRLLKLWRLQAENDQESKLTNPPNINENLQDDVIWRAIAAVTEAISCNSPAEGEPIRFVLVDPATISLMRMARHFPGFDIDTTQTVARPGNEALLVRTDGDAERNRFHNSLYFLRRRTADNHFELASYDSARQGFHRHNNQVISNEFREHLTTLGWERSDPSLVIAPNVVKSDPAARQQTNWECGIYVIIYAWALALGLDISNFASVGPVRQAQFLGTAVELIKFALQGYCDSATIETFLKCFNVVENNATIPAGRQFDRTVPFQDENTLRAHIARLRLQHDLNRRDSPSLDEMLSVIRRANREFELELWDRTVEDVMEQYAMALSALPGVAPGDSASGSTEDDTGGDASERSVTQASSAPNAHVASEHNLLADGTNISEQPPSMSCGGGRAPHSPFGTQLEDESADDDLLDAGPPGGGDFAKAAATDNSPASTVTTDTDGYPTVTPPSQGQRNQADLTSTPPSDPPSEGSLLTVLPANLNAAPATITTTTLTSNVQPDPLDAEAQAFSPHTPAGSQIATLADTGTTWSDPSPSAIQLTPAPQPSRTLGESNEQQYSFEDAPLSPGDDLFGEDIDDNDNEDTETAKSATSAQRSATSLEINTSQRSPGLALPPPTPRNTGFAHTNLPGLYPPSHAAALSQAMETAAEHRSPSRDDRSSAASKRPLDNSSPTEEVAKRVKRDSFGSGSAGQSQEEVAEEVQNDLEKILREGSEGEDEAVESVVPDLSTILQHYGVDHQEDGDDSRALATDDA